MPPHIRTGTSFGQVCIQTLSLLKIRIRPMLIGALSFALLSAVIAAAIGQKVGRIEDQITLSAGVTREQLQRAVDHRVTAFTETDASVLMQMFRSGTPPLSEGETLTEDGATFAFIAGIGPWLLLSVLLHGVVLFIACVLFLLLAADNRQSPYDTAARLPGMIPAMLGLSVWLFFRSLLWIPFLGWLLALYLFPRLALAPALLAGGKTGIRSTLRESMRRTKGRVLSVLLSLIGAALLAVVFLWLGIILVAAVALFSIKLSLVLSLFLFYIVAAFQMFFLTALAASME